MHDLKTNLVEDAFRRYSRPPMARKSFSFLHPFSGTKGGKDMRRLLQVKIVFETAKVRNEAYPPQIKYLAKQKTRSMGSEEIGIWDPRPVLKLLSLREI